MAVTFSAYRPLRSFRLIGLALLAFALRTANCDCPSPYFQIVEVTPIRGTDFLNTDVQAPLKILAVFSDNLFVYLTKDATETTAISTLSSATLLRWFKTTTDGSGMPVVYLRGGRIGRLVPYYAEVAGYTGYDVLSLNFLFTQQPANTTLELVIQGSTFFSRDGSSIPAGIPSYYYYNRLNMSSKICPMFDDVQPATASGAAAGSATLFCDVDLTKPVDIDPARNTLQQSHKTVTLSTVADVANSTDALKLTLFASFNGSGHGVVSFSHVAIMDNSATVYDVIGDTLSQTFMINKQDLLVTIPIASNQTVYDVYPKSQGIFDGDVPNDPSFSSSWMPTLRENFGDYLLRFRAGVLDVVLTVLPSLE
eukprot:Opistho-2@71115